MVMADTHQKFRVQRLQGVPMASLCVPVTYQPTCSRKSVYGDGEDGKRPEEQALITQWKPPNFSLSASKGRTVEEVR